MNDETEIKLRITDLASARRLIERYGFQISVPEVFERNIVLDNANGDLRTSRRLLRLRQAGNIVTVTYKGVATVGKHKAREERETAVASFAEMLVIFERLGYTQTFVYEKYRTEFRAQQGGVVTLDETPVGNFLEIEGSAEWIDATAHLLGFAEAEYLTASYGSLYTEWCQKHNVTPTNMTFTGPRSVPDPVLSLEPTRLAADPE